MRMTPAQRHLQRIHAAQAAAQASPHGEVQGSAYELMLAQLTEHRRSLKDIQSIERKIDFKRQVLADYDAWIDGALAHGRGAQDQVLTTLLVWHIDTGSFERALQIAHYALAHGLSLPDQYDRSLPVVVIDEFADAALKGAMPADQAGRWLGMALALTEGHDAPDEARAKLYKAIGYALIGRLGRQEAEVDELPLDVIQAALPPLQRALALHQQVGVKKDIERLERRLRKLTGTPGT